MAMKKKIMIITKRKWLSEIVWNLQQFPAGATPPCFFLKIANTAASHTFENANKLHDALCARTQVEVVVVLLVVV